MRRLVLFSDGTWRRWKESGNTNVVRLCQIVAEEPEQRRRYDAGVGTNFFKFTGGAFGVGISKNIRDLYSFIVHNQAPGCEIYLFGFSRGAFTVRSLGGMLDVAGVLKTHDERLIKQAFELYKKGDRAAAKAFSDEHSHFDFKIRMIGVWDTVGALGVPSSLLNRLNPFSHRFHNTHLGAGVEIALHAVAIDESRRTYPPTLWTPREGEALEHDGQTIRQVWFAGDHSDVGGGHEEHHLSDVALQWMVEQIEALDVGLRLAPQIEWPFVHDPQPTGQLHNPRRGLFRLWKAFRRSIAEDATLHSSVRTRILDADLCYRPVNLPAEPAFVD